MNRLQAVVAVATLAAAVGAGAPARAGAVLDRVKAAGSLSCGVLTEPEDDNKEDVHAALPALDRDMCRAIATAVLGSPDKANLVELPAEQPGFLALKAGTIDILMGATPSLAATIRFGVGFARPVFLDGDALLVHRGSGIASFADLADKLICYTPGTPSAEVLDSEAERRHVAIRRFAFDERGEMLAAVATRTCDALFGPVSRLVSGRNSFHALAKDFVLLPERYSVLPVAPAVASGDPAWAEVVDAVADAPLLAESGGIDRATAASLATSEDPPLRGLAGLLPGVPDALVDRSWGVRVVALLGNYDEVYERDLGSNSSLGIPRGPNALWTKGGLMVPEPLP